MGWAQTNLRYIENKGQWPEPVTFKADAPAATIWVERQGILIDRHDGEAMARRHAAHGRGVPGPEPPIRHHAVRLKFIGATGPAAIEKLGASNDHFNYFIGSDPRRWASKARAWAHMTLKELYPGVDLAIHAQGKALKYDLVLAAGADPSAIALTYEGADKLELRGEKLVIHTSLGEMIEAIPAAWQTRTDGTRQPIQCWYTLKNGVVRMLPENIDPTLPLTIDPTLEFSTYSGSTSDNFGYTATFDEEGFLYSGSSAFGQGYPTTVGAYQTTHAGGSNTNEQGTDIALTKYDTTGSFLRWSTFLGGSGDDLPHSLICNADGELFVFGTTSSTDFPVTSNAFDPTWNGGTAWSQPNLGVNYVNGADMIIARLSADGTQLDGSTYFGGSLNDGLNTGYGTTFFNYADEIRGEILLDAADHVFVVSTTQSFDMPVTPGAYQTTIGGGTHDGIVARFSPDLSTLVWSSFFGGTGVDAVYACELGDQGELFFTGGTISTDLPVTPGAVGPSNLGGTAEAFIARLDNDGSTLGACSYWGSTQYDQAYFVDKDGEGDIYVFGQTAAPLGELILNAPFNHPNGGQFISKFDPGLQTVLFSSRFGNGTGIPNISPTAFLVDYCRRIYVAGWGSNIGVGAPLTTNGMDLLITADAFQSTTDGNDFFIGVFDIDMSALDHGTYFGGPISDEHVDGGTSRFSRRGEIYESVCAGCAASNDDFPTTPGAWSATNNSANCNNAVFKIDFDAPLVVAGIATIDTLCANTSFTFDNLSSGATSYLWTFGDSGSSIDDEPTHAYDDPGVYTVTLIAFDPGSCNGADTAQVQVFVDVPGPQVQAMNDTLICGPVASVQLIANGFGTVDAFLWSTSPLFTDTLNTTPQDSTALLDPAQGGTYYVMASNASACTAIDSVLIAVSLTDPVLSGDSLICADEIATLHLTGIDAGSTITWQPDDEIDSGQGTTTVTTSPPVTQGYTVDVTSPAGCTWSGSIVVNVSWLSGSAVSATVDQAIVLPGTTVQLGATPVSGVTYSWSPAGLVSDPTIANPTAVVNTTTTFVVTVSDGICTRDGEVTVTVYELNCAEPDIFVPNTFTPNGDGNNDVLYVRGLPITELLFRVFDRWGEKVFETDDRSEGWDGTFKGREVDPAVYVWYLDATCADHRSIFMKGNVTVVR